MAGSGSPCALRTHVDAELLTAAARTSGPGRLVRFRPVGRHRVKVLLLDLHMVMALLGYHANLGWPKKWPSRAGAAGAP